MLSFLASASKWPLVALASTPPLVFRLVFRPPAAWASEGPFLPPSFFAQWSPTFSKLCFTAAQATWLARFSSLYSSAAESCAFANVRWAFPGERFSVIRNGVNVDHFRPAASAARAVARDALLKPRERFLVVCVANLWPIKGIEVLAQFLGDRIEW